MIVVGGVLAAVYLMLAQRPSGRVASSMIALVAHPAVGVAWCSGLIVVARTERIRRRAHRDKHLQRERLLAVDLVAHGVGAGVAFANAVQTAAMHVDEVVASDLARGSRLAAHYLPSEDVETPIHEMFRLASSSAASGAALASDLRRLVETEAAEMEADRLTRLERLPVKMLVPLAFLILPGFLLVAVVPTVIGGLSRLTM